MYQLSRFRFSLIFCTATLSYAHADLFDPNRAYLFGDWAGERSKLLAQGISFNANASVETAYLASGGRDPRSSPEFASQLSLGSVLDMNKLAGWQDVTIRATVTARQGQSLTAKSISDPETPQLGNVQSLYGRGNSKSRLSEFSIEKKFKDLNLDVKVGRFGIGNDFNIMACDFQSNAFCFSQVGKWQSGIWYNSPVSQWAGRAKYHIQPDLFTQIGVYEFNPQNALERHGWNLDTKQADGLTIPVEVVWSPKKLVNDLAGSYRLGVMYNTADDIKNQKDILTGQREDHTYAAWLTMEQQLSAAEEGSRRGLHSFANLTFHSRVTNRIESSQQFGFKYIGLLPSQPNDILGFGINRIQLNDRFKENKPRFNKEAEYNLELNYSYYPRKWLMLRPNVQYVIHPGASDRVENPLVLGLTSKIIF